MTSNVLSPSAMLATHLHAQPGVYALLLGSGVSTGAGVPTGWGVVAQLVRMVAAAQGGESEANDAERDPAAWWAQQRSDELGYSSLLKELAPTPAARQGILAPFFEPSDEDREEGVKVPSRAHRAVAKLVKDGYVKIVLTTNFDRLTEEALRDEGVSLQVISRPEAVNGMAPLTRGQPTVIKLHGDYTDLASRNTTEELGSYPPEWTTLLRQVFDEYGLVVSGWSANWDPALVRALEETPNRRYPMYWDSLSSHGAAAQRLLGSREGRVITCGGADELFGDLAESVEALKQLSQPPLTTAMAVSRLKRYLPDPVRRIDLHDMVMDAADDLARWVGNLPLQVQGLETEVLERRWDETVAATAPLARLLANGIWHDGDGTHLGLWVDALQRVIEPGTTPIAQVTMGLDETRKWAALVALTTAGVASAQRGREQHLITLATVPAGRVGMGHGSWVPAAQLLHPDRVLGKAWRHIPRAGRTRSSYAPSRLLQHDVRSFFDSLIPDDVSFRRAFYGYEYRLGLIHERQNAEWAEAGQVTWATYRATAGEYLHRREWSRATDAPIAEEGFRRAVGRTGASEWLKFLDVGDLEHHLIAHREVLKQVRDPEDRW